MPDDARSPDLTLDGDRPEVIPGATVEIDGATYMVSTVRRRSGPRGTKTRVWLREPGPFEWPDGGGDGGGDGAGQDQEA